MQIPEALTSLGIDEDLETSPTFRMWNAHMCDFLEQCMVVFPKHTHILEERIEEIRAFEKSKSTVSMPVKIYMKFMDPYKDELGTKDEEKLFAIAKVLPTMKELPVEKYWPRLCDETKEQFWERIQFLTVMGDVLSKAPPALVNSLESFMSQQMKQMEDSGESIDLESLGSSSIMKMVNRMLTGGGRSLPPSTQ